MSFIEKNRDFDPLFTAAPYLRLPFPVPRDSRCSPSSVPPSIRYIFSSY